MGKIIQRTFSIMLMITVLTTTSITVFAKANVNYNKHINYNKYGSFNEKIETQINKDGSKTFTNLITNEVSGEVAKVVVNDKNNSREVKVYINDTLEKVTSVDKLKNIIKIQDIQSGSIQTIDSLLISDSSLEHLKETITLDDTPSYPYLQSLYHSKLGKWGYLYGKNNITYGTTHSIQISEGTRWSAALSIVAAVMLPGSTAIGILVALGCTAIGVTIDTALNGEIYARYDRWDYEVFSQDKLGLRTYQIDIDQKVVDSNSGDVTYLDIDTDGYPGTREDMLYEGIYNVYVENL